MRVTLLCVTCVVDALAFGHDAMQECGSGESLEHSTVEFGVTSQLLLLQREFSLTSYRRAVGIQNERNSPVAVVEYSSRKVQTGAPTHPSSFLDSLLDSVWPSVDSYSYLLVALILVACGSICHDAYKQIGSDKDCSRDKLWDIVKFILIICVVYHHTKYVTGANHDHFLSYWYVDIMMPGFFLISGLFQQGRGPFDAAILKRVFRDNVLNNFLFALVLLFANSPHKTMLHHECTLWFLWAMAFCRLFLNPCYKAMTHILGEVIGSIVGVFGIGFVIVGYWLLKLSTISDFLALVLFLVPWLVQQMFQNAIFYMIGLSVKRDCLRRVIASPYATFAAVPFLILRRAMWEAMGGQELRQQAPLDASVTYLAILYLWQTLGVLAIFACVAPIADASNAALASLGRLLAGWGSRSLYGYFLHLLIFFALPNLWSRIAWLGYNHFVHIPMLIIFSTALCSSLAERCFGWLVSPQWILDSGAFVWSLASGLCEPATTEKAMVGEHDSSCK